jgi:hypothetical protein
VANQIPLNQQATQTQTLAGVLPVLFELVGTAETIIPSNPNAGSPLSVPMQPNTTIEQTPFDVWLSGYFKTLNTTNVTLKLYEGVSETIGSNTLLGTSGAIAQNTATASWWIHAMLQFDSVSGALVGKIEFYVNKTLVAAVTLSNFPTGFLNQGNPSANPPTLANLPVFSVTATSSAATALLPTAINVQKFSAG